MKRDVVFDAEVLMEAIFQSAWDYAMQDPEPDDVPAIAAEVDRQRAAQEALMEEVINRAWEYAIEDPEPGEGQCLFCGGWCAPPLVEGWTVVCSACLVEDCDDE